MESTAANPAQPRENVQALQALNEQLRTAVEQKDERIQALEHQLNWFKRQLFGEKSEKRDMTDNPYQQTIADLLKELPEVPKRPEEEKQNIRYQRGKAKKNGSIRILQGFKVLISHRFPSTFGVAKASNERGCGIYDYQQAYRKIA